MKIFKTVEAIQDELNIRKKNGASIGFVPTMGALHRGHIELMQRAKRETDCVVVSVFVNPTQFNDPQDFEKYPRTLQKDIELLQTQNIDCLFIPDEQEMYRVGQAVEHVDLAGLDIHMEGKFRPGHFQGVVQVVRRLFDIIAPDFAYFGEKDFQQLSIIRYVNERLRIATQIIACPTVRNEHGLALSSRNARLNEQQQLQATILYQTLMFARNFQHTYSPDELKKYCIEKIEKNGLKVEYFEIVHAQTLIPLSNTWTDNAVACVAAYCENVRLIDNIHLN